MTDKSVFTEDEWHALAEAPLLISLAMVAAGQHGPISVVKEASASARAMARPGDRGPANELIAASPVEKEQRTGGAYERVYDSKIPNLVGRDR